MKKEDLYELIVRLESERLDLQVRLDSVQHDAKFWRDLYIEKEAAKDDIQSDD